MIYLIVLTFNWEPDAIIIKLKQPSNVKWTHLKKILEKKKTEEKNQILRKSFFQNKHQLKKYVFFSNTSHITLISKIFFQYCSYFELM